MKYQIGDLVKSKSMGEGIIMPTNHEAEKYEVGDLVIYYGYGNGSKLLGVVVKVREYAQEVEVAWVNNVTSKVDAKLVRKATENVSI